MAHVSFSYPGCEALFKDISLCFGKGENTLLCGENGSGKSTILKLLTGYLRPQSGVIHCDNELVQKVTAKQGKKYMYLTQNAPSQILGINLQQDIRLWQIAGYQIGVQTLHEHPLLEHLPIDIFDVPVKELSSGTVQAYLLALALLATDRFLILDEPLLSLDMQRQEAFIHLLSKRKGMVIVCHQTQRYDALLDVRCCIEDGVLRCL